VNLHKSGIHISVNYETDWTIIGKISKNLKVKSP
jgi:hypothetical protein